MENTKELSLKERMRRFEIGEYIELPIEKLYTAKQYASDLTLLTGRKYASHIDRERSVVKVVREA